MTLVAELKTTQLLKSAYYSVQVQQQYVLFKRLAILDPECHEQAMIGMIR